MSRFLEALHSGRVLLMDGAMGTELQRAGMPEGACYEEWNLTQPEKVLAIHKAYVDAGAEVVLTNTFQAYQAILKKHNLDVSQEHIWKSGVELARKAVGSVGFVLADFGPVDQATIRDVEPIIKNSRQADALLFETLSIGRDIDLFFEFHRAFMPRPSLPCICSFTFLWHPAGKLRTHEKWSPQACAAFAEEHSMAALGVNCGREIGLSDVVAILKEYRSATDLPLFARPNAGTPTKIDGRWHYPVTPEQMAAAVPALIEAGATMIGGCCGTTPAHIAALRMEVDKWNARIV